MKDNCFTDFFFNQTSTWISHSYTYIPSLLNLPPISFPSHPSRLIHGSNDEREFNLKLWCSCHQESWLLIGPSRKFYKMCFGKDQACKHEYGRVDPPALIFWRPELPWDHPLPWLLQSAGLSPQGLSGWCLLMPSLWCLHLCGAGPGKIQGVSGPEQVWQQNTGIQGCMTPVVTWNWCF